MSFTPAVTPKRHCLALEIKSPHKQFWGQPNG